MQIEIRVTLRAKIREVKRRAGETTSTRREPERDLEARTLQDAGSVIHKHLHFKETGHGELTDENGGGPRTSTLREGSENAE